MCDDIGVDLHERSAVFDRYLLPVVFSREAQQAENAVARVRNTIS
jgi:hypothetical protein